MFWAAGRQAVTGRRRRAVGSVVLSESPLDLTDAQALPVLLEVNVGEHPSSQTTLFGCFSIRYNLSVSTDQASGAGQGHRLL